MTKKRTRKEKSGCEPYLLFVIGSKSSINQYNSYFLKTSSAKVLPTTYRINLLIQSTPVPLLGTSRAFDTLYKVANRFNKCVPNQVVLHFFIAIKVFAIPFFWCF